VYNAQRSERFMSRVLRAVGPIDQLQVLNSQYDGANVFETQSLQCCAIVSHTEGQLGSDPLEARSVGSGYSSGSRT